MSGNRKDAKKILEKAKHFEIISFDIFDTLIKRNVKTPSDVFDLVEIRYNLDAEEKISNFKSKRLQAYYVANQKNGTCCLDEIYDELDFSTKVKDYLKEIEQQIEVDVCVANPEIVDVLLKLRELGKRIFIISDMYLSKTVVKKILDKNGITEDKYEGLYISCECKAKKTSGSLYDFVCKKNSFTPKQALHIGDNWKGDIIRAKQKGFAVYHLPTAVSNLEYIDKNNKFNIGEQFVYNTLNSISNNIVTNNMSEFEKLGVQLLGPLMFGFVTWLNKEVEKKQIKKVFFLAREGDIIKKAYDMLYQDDKISTQYMYASRRSIIVPSYWANSEYNEICQSMSRSVHMNISEWFFRLGLDVKEYKNLLREKNIDFEYSFNGRELENNEIIKDLYECIRKDVEKNSKEEYLNLEAYFKQIDFCGEDVAIVDVGWNGGMQKAFENLPYVRENQMKIHGYYFGIDSSALKVRFANANGYIYEYEKNSDYRYYIMGFAGPFEMSMMTTHGSVFKFKQTSSNIEPVFLPHEYIDETGKNTKEMDSIILLQKGLLEFVKVAKEMKLHEMFCIQSKEAFANYFLFATEPKRKHLKLYENYGAVDLKAEQNLIGKDYHHLFGEYSIKKGLDISTWKIGFMRYIARLPLPYKDIYMFLRKR